MATVPPPLEHIGSYRLLRELGSSAYSRSYESTNPASGVACQVTVYSELFAAQPDFVSHYRQTCGKAQMVQHLKAAKVIDFDVDGNHPFLVSDLIDGQNLADSLRENSSLPTDRVLRSITDALEILQELHESGAVHRDLRPASIFVTEYNDTRVGNLGQEGLLPLDQFKLSDGTLFGSPLYLAPEVCLGQEYTPQSDLYALACVAFHLLTGQPPFEGSSADEIVRLHPSQRAPRLIERRGDLTQGLSMIIEQAMSKEPTSRYRDAATMLADWRNEAKAAAAAVEQAEMSGERPAVGAAAPEEGVGTGLKLRMPAGGQQPAYDPGFQAEGANASPGFGGGGASDSDLAAIMPRGPAAAPASSSAQPKDVVSSGVTLTGKQINYGRGDEQISKRLRSHDEKISSGFPLWIVVLVIALGLIGGGGYFLQQEGFFEQFGNSGSNEFDAQAAYEEELEKWNTTRDRVSDLYYAIINYERLKGRAPRVSDLVDEDLVDEEDTYDGWDNILVYDRNNQEIIAVGEDGDRYTGDDFVYDLKKDSFTSSPSRPSAVGDDGMDEFGGLR